MPAEPQAMGPWASDLLNAGALDERVVTKNRKGEVRTFDAQALKLPDAPAAIDGKRQLFRLDDAAKVRAGLAKDLDAYVVKK